MSRLRKKYPQRNIGQHAQINTDLMFRTSHSFSISHKVNTSPSFTVSPGRWQLTSSPPKLRRPSVAHRYTRSDCHLTCYPVNPPKPSKQLHLNPVNKFVSIRKHQGRSLSKMTIGDPLNQSDIRISTLSQRVSGLNNLLSKNEVGKACVYVPKTWKALRSSKGSRKERVVESLEYIVVDTSLKANK